MKSTNEAADAQLDRQVAYALLRAIIGVKLAVHGMSRPLAGPHAFAASLVGMFHATLLPAWSLMAFGLVLPWLKLRLASSFSLARPPAML
jgi:thiosulfate dehydrogenase [quinone] large subunit